MQTNIKIELGQMTVTDSTFTDGSNHHIIGEEAEVTLDNVFIYNSAAVDAYGHGLYCILCDKVLVSNSTFFNLTAGKGSVIYLENLQNNDSSIHGNHFE